MEKITDMEQKIVNRTFLSQYLLLLVLIAEIIIGRLINPALLSPMNIKAILFACTVNGIIALGQSLVLISREFDLSVGANLVFSPFMAVGIVNSFMKSTTGVGILQGNTGIMASGWAAVVVLTIVIATLVGFLNGLLTTKLKITSFISTLGMQFFLNGSAYVVSRGIPVFFGGTAAEDSQFIGNAVVGGLVPVSVLVFLAIGLILLFLCAKTKFGMRLYATGGGLKAARLSGINTDRWKIIAYALSGLLVGITSVLWMSRLRGIDITQGNAGYDMTSIAISIIGGISLSGGKGSLAGTMQATAIITILLNILNLFGLMAYYQTAIMGAIIVVIAIVRKNDDSKRLKRLKIIEV